ncbi:MAG TPA: FadR/GntR family transcriptional regulator [Bosea sp. (in: a-proteobacteria)]|jgi:DNA-binding FadR family transcriptional regulator|nr:FadR/GntR family transcriptional regulator [Bosea sp. (in: a-proteobacteria)]
MARPSNFHAHLVDRLGREIVSGQIGLDGTLPREDELCARYGVSRTVIREATKTLQALGLIVTGPRVGSRVQPVSAWRLLDPQLMGWITDADMASGFQRDLLELRGMIEPTAAGLAAERGTDEQIAEITAAMAGMTAADDKLAHQTADYRFHEAILEASGNLLLIQLKPVLHAVLSASFGLSMHDHERARASLAIHRVVADAIVARDPEAARRTMAELIAVARADMENAARTKSEAPKSAGTPTIDQRETSNAASRGKVGLTRA